MSVSISQEFSYDRPNYSDCKLFGDGRGNKLAGLGAV
jgi:hypothetical protein